MNSSTKLNGNTLCVLFNEKEKSFVCYFTLHNEELCCVQSGSIFDCISIAKRELKKQKKSKACAKIKVYIMIDFNKDVEKKWSVRNINNVLRYIF
jgi:hypothetical protein